MIRNLNREKAPYLLCLLTAVILILVGGMFVLNHWYEDKTKPNIFEIPGTRHYQENDRYVSYDGVSIQDHRQGYRYFMMQKTPREKAEFHNMIQKFIEDNSVVNDFFDSANKAYTQTNLCVRFMIPSWRFPVYFEQNKNYWIMDDYVTGYVSTNCVVAVSFESKFDKGNYCFYDDVIEKAPRRVFMK